MLLGALLILLAGVAALEICLAVRGYRTTLSDSTHLWNRSRALASTLGSRALILIGNSRMRMDIDLDTLHRMTGLQPVQLAIDGARSFEPMLEALARDPSIQGTVVISYLDNVPLPGQPAFDNTQMYEAEYQWARMRPFFAFEITEAALDDIVRSRLRSYADGTNPIDALRTRVFTETPFPQFVSTLPDRSQFADFTRVPMPAFYYGRVKRWISDTEPLPTDGNFAALESELRAQIAGIPPADNTTFLKSLSRIEAWVAAIRAHGGRVTFVDLPSSGMIREMERERYPRAMFWDKFKESTSAQTLNVEDDATLSDFICPDGSHLDVRQIRAFTVALVHALALDLAPAAATPASGNGKM